MNKYVPMIIISVLAMVFIGTMFVAFNTTDVLKNISIDFTYIEALVTLGAIAVAIYIPNRIADQQNKIALFEKRYELYTIYSILVEFGNKTSNGVAKSSGILSKHQLGVLLINSLIPNKYKEEMPTSGDEQLDQLISMTYQINNYMLALEKIKYLFQLDEKEEEILQDILLILADYVYEIKDLKIKFEDFQKKSIRLIDLIVEPTILTTMQKQLQLSSEVK